MDIKNIIIAALGVTVVVLWKKSNEIKQNPNNNNNGNNSNNDNGNNNNPVLCDCAKQFEIWLQQINSNGNNNNNNWNNEPPDKGQPLPVYYDRRLAINGLIYNRKKAIPNTI